MNTNYVLDDSQEYKIEKGIFWIYFNQIIVIIIPNEVSFLNSENKLHNHKNKSR